jgi:endonuclease G
MDMQIGEYSWPNYGRVHSGFYDCYSSVKQDVLDSVLAAGITNRKVWLTGHSLGGALATLAAADLREKLEVVGVYTFGQPRLCKNDFKQIISNNFPDKFFRFVNDDDIITRIPPGYEHVGKLIHFDAYGNVQQSAIEVETIEIEANPLTESEFRELQNEIRGVRAAVESSPIEGGFGESFDVTKGEGKAIYDSSVEGLIPSVSDHYMERYIAAIRRYALGSTSDSMREVNDAKLVFDTTIENISPRTFSDIAIGVEMEALNPLDITEYKEETFPVLLRCDPNWQPSPTIKVNSRFGGFASAQVSINDLKMLGEDPDVFAIEASREAGKLELANSIPFVGGAAIHRPPIDEKGDSAIVGIIDTGVDILHEAFRNDVGKTRILAFWDQKDTTGPSPYQVDPACFSQNYGTLYLEGDINNFITSGVVPTTGSGLRDPAKHGTHVASIAAGQGVGALANGMAPAAKIMVVAPYMKTDPGSPPSLGYSNSHVDALNFLKSAAKGQNQVLSNPLPIVVNVSLGMNAGAHDGSSLLEAAFDGITGSGREPGFVIVKSAGNERNQNGHDQIKAVKGGTQTIAWISNSAGLLPASRSVDYFELWYSPYDDLEFQLKDPAGNLSNVVSLGTANVTGNLGGNSYQMSLTRYHPDNGASQLTLTIKNGNQPIIQNGTWELSVTGNAINSRDALVDMWVERDNNRPVRFINQEQKVTLSIPGTARTIITVAACNAAHPLRLNPSSSYGKTWDGRPKPDVCAPGLNILAAHANQKDHRAVVAMPGTSMAAPHVTGALALVLSCRHKQPLKPQHDAVQLQQALIRNAKNFTGVHHEGFGYGALDAEMLFNALK